MNLALREIDAYNTALTLRAQTMFRGGVHLDVEPASVLGSVCDPNANPPIPDGLLAWSKSGVKLTPDIQQWAASIANDMSIPIGSIFKKWFGNVPVVGIVLCHSYTVLPDGSTKQGAYHGVTVFYPTKAEMMPPNGTTPPVPAENPPHAGPTLIDFIFLGTVLLSASFAISNAILQSNGERRVALKPRAA